MNQQQKDVWLAALRSGQYPQQLKGVLKTPGGYCCLGVANEVLDLQSSSESFLRGKDAKMVFLPLDTQIALATMNDSGRPFPQIADCIEQYILPTE